MSRRFMSLQRAVDKDPSVSKPGHREHRSKKGRNPHYSHDKMSLDKKRLHNKKTLKYDDIEIKREIKNLL